MLYDPTQFERLIDEPWDAARVRDAIATIVADTDAAFRGDALWPADEQDEWHEGEPLKTLYSGAAGVIWALDVLRPHAETSLDLVAALERALELERAKPDVAEDGHYTPESLFDGETGILVVAHRLTGEHGDELQALVRGNVDNPTDDISWGAPGTLLVALALGWGDLARESATALRARRGDDGLWRQDDDYRGLGTLHGAAGNTLALLRFEPDEQLARETAELLSRTAFREDGFANWPGTPRAQLARPRDGRICLQWCTGAPGVLAGAWEYLDEELALAAAELTWHAGAHGAEKGHGLCHGTSGSGFALLKAFARTGDELWLERARRFAVHALAQAAKGSRRHSLFTGDVGTALFAAACLDADTRFPVIDVL